MHKAHAWIACSAKHFETEMLQITVLCTPTWMDPGCCGRGAGHGSGPLGPPDDGAGGVRYVLDGGVTMARARDGTTHGTAGAQRRAAARNDGRVRTHPTIPINASPFGNKNIISSRCSLKSAPRGNLRESNTTNPFSTPLSSLRASTAPSAVFVPSQFSSEAPRFFPPWPPTPPRDAAPLVSSMSMAPNP